MRVLALAGSLRSGSLNRELLRLAAAHAPAGVEIELYEGLREIPPYDADREAPTPLPVERFADAVRAADAVLVATPEYNASIPGVLKNALDWASRPNVASGAFFGKPAAVVSASTGAFGAIWAQAELNKVLRTVGARVVETSLAVARAHERLAAPDEELVDDLGRVVRLLAGEVEPAMAPALAPVRAARRPRAAASRTAA